MTAVEQIQYIRDLEGQRKLVLERTDQTPETSSNVTLADLIRRNEEQLMRLVSPVTPWFVREPQLDWASQADLATLAARPISRRSENVALEDHTPERPSDPPSQQYREKLKAIGATALLDKISAAEEIARFQDAVLSHGLRFYQQLNVERYLIAEAHKANPQWSGTFQVQWTPVAKYAQPIPEPVIDTMQWVKGEFPEAQFFISEVKRYPDPFLMVRLHGFVGIIERWDEPAYRESED